MAWDMSITHKGRIMSERKVIFVGPSGSGKTTAIETICRARNERTESSQDDDSIVQNLLFGDAVDYQLLNLNCGQSLQLLGVQGNQSSNVIKALIRCSGNVVVLMINDADKDPIACLREQLLQLSELVQTTRVVVGVTHMDVSSGTSLMDYNRELHKFKVFENLQQSIPLCVVDPRDWREVAMLLETALYKQDPPSMLDEGAELI